MTSVGAAIGSTKAALDILRIAVAARDDAKISAALQELQDRCYINLLIASTDLAEKNASLVEQLATARDQMLQLERRATDAEKKAATDAEYELTELAQGVFVLVHGPSVKATKNPHYLCAKLLPRRQALGTAAIRHLGR